MSYVAAMSTGGKLKLKSGKLTNTCDCCQEYNNTCTSCYATNQTPRYIEVTYTGVQDCGLVSQNCAAINGTWILEATGVPCYYGYQSALWWTRLHLLAGYIEAFCVTGNDPVCFWASATSCNDEVTGLANELTVYDCTDAGSPDYNEGYGGTVTSKPL